MSWLARMREGLRGLLFAGREDAEMDEEMRFHLEMETERLMRERGLDRPEARRRAAVVFGGVEKHREAVRDARGLGWVSSLSLDLRLGLRMLVKYPGLALVGGVGMAVAIAIGAASATFFYNTLYPTLPLDEGDRIVALENWNTAANNEERRSVHDLATWRRELRTVQDVGAFRTIRRSLVVPGGPAELVDIAEMTASGFRVARVPPLLGRPLVEEDERPGAPPAVVLGYRAWQTRFSGNPRIVGRSARLGNTVHTVAGVMPEGFAFPVDHEFWVPLRADPSAFARGEGPEIFIFGRLAPGVTREQAGAELAGLGRRAAAAFPRTHAKLRPQVLPYTYPISDIQDVSLWEVGMMQATISLLLVVVAVNVSILVYARTATRQGEIAVRSALGASRRRIVAQLFTEALVFAAAAALVGLGLARVGLRQAELLLEQESGGAAFWTDYGLSSFTLLYVAGLTVLTALIVGVVPALQATGSRLQSSLRQLGGGTGMRMGTLWTTLIVAQVAIAVAALPVAVSMGWGQIREAATRPRFAVDDYFMTRLAMDQEPPEGVDPEVYQRERAARFATVQAEFVRRLEAEPTVDGVTLGMLMPGQEPSARVVFDGVAAGSAGHEVRFNRVDVDFFATFGAAVLLGRGFTPADRDTAASAVIVNRSFVRQHLGGGSVLGRRLRYVAEEEAESGDAKPARWYEIVGVVDDLHANAIDPELAGATLYHPLAVGQIPAVGIGVRVPGGAQPTFAARLREISTAVDPTLRMRAVPLSETYRQERVALRLVALVLGLVMLSVLLLSAGGIYALMSFTVTRRRREIGIRAALGANPGRLLRSVFSRALGQIAAGLLVGLVAAAALDRATGGGLMGGRGAVLLPVVAALMLAAGLLAALGPARRGLRIQPGEALKADA